MRTFIYLSIFLLFTEAAYAQLTPYEKGNKNQSATYDEIINWYQMLDAKSNFVNVSVKGTTDAEKPLHLVLISSDKKLYTKYSTGGYEFVKDHFNWDILFSQFSNLLLKNYESWILNSNPILFPIKRII